MMPIPISKPAEEGSVVDLLLVEGSRDYYPVLFEPDNPSMIGPNGT